MKFLRLAATTVLSIPVIGSLMTTAANAHQVEVSSSGTRMPKEILNADTDPTNILPTVLIASSANASESGDSRVGTLLGIAAVGGTAAGALWIASKGNRPFQLPSIGRDPTARIDQASPQLQRQLLKLLHNDRATASRLLAQIKRNHPDKSMNWAVEKAIYDLERDRWR